MRGSGGDGCILCSLSRDREHDRENYVLYRNDLLYVVLNRYPYINGHLMVVPHSHAAGLRSLGPEELEALGRAEVLCERALLERYYATLAGYDHGAYDFEDSWRDYRRASVGGPVMPGIASMIRTSPPSVP